MTEEDKDMATGQRKHAKKWPPYDECARIISYNVNENGRPSGAKIRYKIRVVSGREAATLDRHQADAIKEYLSWAGVVRRGYHGSFC